MIILNNGNVGIGTTSPRNTLEVNGITRLNSAIEYGGTSGTSFDINNQLAGMTRLYGTGIQFRTAATDPAMTILNTGNVGIGTTNPQSKLEVAGAINTDDIRVSAGGHSAGLAVDTIGSFLEPLFKMAIEYSLLIQMVGLL